MHNLTGKLWRLVPRDISTSIQAVITATTLYQLLEIV